MENDIIKSMNLEEKAALTSGADWWKTKEVERLGIPAVMLSDGPHGLRKLADESDSLDLTPSIKAVCFPSASALAGSFNRDILALLGDRLGKEALHEKVNTLLGPAINIKRSPLCGRNFEYFSEDPYLAGELAAAYVKALQKNGVGACVKHFAANNQEYRRMSIDVRASEQALREIYLAAFEKVVKTSQPYAIMCSYNKVNGTYSCENEWLLTKVLRDEWKFDGIVMSDWGAMNRRCDALKAGLDLEMPSSNGENDKLIVDAIRKGTLPEEVLDKAVKRLLNWINKTAYSKSAENEAPYDYLSDHEVAGDIEAECAVLLKNNGVLPLNKDQRVAFIGAFAEKPRYQGGGSSHVNSFKITSALEAAGGKYNISYAPGFSIESDELYEDQLAEALDLAKNSDVAVIFAGLPDSYESEGYDRTHLSLPDNQNQLIEQIAVVQKNIVVVLHNGSPVTMPWIDKVSSVLEMYLGGENVGSATIDLLYGHKNPSGKLAETFPLRLEDTPCFLNFPGGKDYVNYAEGIYVGYRWYDARKLPVLFPFGFGLSYTTFEYSNLRISDKSINENDTLTVYVDIKNTGMYTGKEVVQLYIAPPQDISRRRPVLELKGFDKVELSPGETKTAAFKLDRRSFAYFEERIGDWFVETGDYTIHVGSSSRDLLLHEIVHVAGTRQIPLIITDSTTCGDVFSSNLDASKLITLISRSKFAMMSNTEYDDSQSMNDIMKDAVLNDMPIHSLVSHGPITHMEIESVIEDLIKQSNKN